jgi:apolipoprotein N-acyltransferase
MSFIQIFLVVKQVFQNRDVILIFVVVLLYLNFVFYITRYKKSTFPSRQKKAKVKTIKSISENDDDKNKTDDDMIKNTSDDEQKTSKKAKSASSDKKK